MIIDYHAHYNNNAYKKPFRNLPRNDDEYALSEGDVDQLFLEFLDAKISYSVELGVSLQSREEVLQLCSENSDRIFQAMGIHPTRSIYEKWLNRHRLDTYAKTFGVMVIGKCGLDYQYKREEQHCLKLSMILHVRDAHKDALRILKLHPARQLGGVIHCFYGSWEIAEQYLKLGYHFGIDGSILQQEERAGALWEAVKHIPLDKILLETDAPFIRPFCKDVIQAKILRRAKNASLILSAVIEKIAEIKECSPAIVEEAIMVNTVRVFSLPINL